MDFSSRCFTVLAWMAAGAAAIRLLARRVRPTPSVRGASVAIVGASSGIGCCLALEYARRGARLVLCARREELLHEVAAACRQHSPNVQVVVGDITHRETQLALRDVAAAAFDGRIDYLVLNAGVISVRPVTELWPLQHPAAADDEEVRGAADRAEALLLQTLGVNAVAPATVAGLFLPLLIASQGVVVVVSSVAGLVAAPTRSLYSASKHALTGYFSAFRMEVARLGVAVTMVYPGTVDTDLRRSAVDSVDSTLPAAGSSRGKLSPHTCACQVIRAAALRQSSLVTPWSYWLVTAVLHPIVPSLVEYLAKKKYGLV
ncbi:hypothetical protein GGI04_001792 [Coemansia thaxteri]|nr:hypothetical protein GGI04_001792 [Coemansia thaxteri]